MYIPAFVFLSHGWGRVWRPPLGSARTNPRYPKQNPYQNVANICYVKRPELFTKIITQHY